MNREEIRQSILDILGAVALDEKIPEIDDNKPLRGQISLDSMDFLDIVMELRKRYKVDIPEKDYHNLSTMQSTVDYLFPKMQNQKP